jgi:uncharacterized protein (DUF1778 family)
VGTDLTAFVVSSVTTAARRVLADRTEFIMSPKVARSGRKRASPFATG